MDKWELQTKEVSSMCLRPRDNGRDGGIRTRDPLHPMQVRYQAALRPEDRKYIRAVKKILREPLKILVVNVDRMDFRKQPDREAQRLPSTLT